MQHHLMLLSFPCSHVSASLFYLFCFAVDLTETAATIVIVSSDERKIVECLLTWLIFFFLSVFMFFKCWIPGVPFIRRSNSRHTSGPVTVHLLHSEFL